MPIDITYPATHIAQITINNVPKFNAMSREMMADLAQAWDELETSDCRAIILTGAGRLS